MLGLNPYALLGVLAGAILLAASSFWFGHKTASDACAAAQLAAETAAVEKYKAEIALNDAAARKLEIKTGAIDVQYRTIVKTVDRIVEKPV